MKFILNSDVEFEADNMDQALAKLTLQFMSMMKAPPILIINNQTPIDLIKVIKSSVSPINDKTTEGFIEVNFVVDHEPPVMMQ